MSTQLLLDPFSRTDIDGRSHDHSSLRSNSSQHKPLPKITFVHFTDQPETDDVIISELEKIVHAMHDSVNRRDFTSLRGHCAENFLATGSGLLFALPADLDRWIVNGKDMVAANPEHHLGIAEIETYIYQNRKKADLFVRVDVTGTPPGIVRRLMCLMVFRRVEGRWSCVNYHVMRGGGVTVPLEE